MLWRNSLKPFDDLEPLKNSQPVIVNDALLATVKQPVLRPRVIQISWILDAKHV